jgi:hypothetical protein
LWEHVIEQHKAGGAALGLSCAACREPLAGVFANSVAVILTSLAGVFASDVRTVFVKNHDFLGIYFRSCKSYIAVTQKIRITTLT